MRTMPRQEHDVHRKADCAKEELVVPDFHQVSSAGEFPAISKRTFSGMRTSDLKITAQRSPRNERTGPHVTIKTVSCPNCSAPVEWSSKAAFRPFCSERCKLQDLGAWATERYRIPEPEKAPQESDPNPPAS